MLASLLSQQLHITAHLKVPQKCLKIFQFSDNNIFFFLWTFLLKDVLGVTMPAQGCMLFIPIVCKLCNVPVWNFKKTRFRLAQILLSIRIKIVEKVVHFMLSTKLEHNRTGYLPSDRARLAVSLCLPYSRLGYLNSGHGLKVCSGRDSCVWVSALRSSEKFYHWTVCAGCVNSHRTASVSTVLTLAAS